MEEKRKGFCGYFELLCLAVAVFQIIMSIWLCYYATPANLYASLESQGNEGTEEGADSLHYVGQYKFHDILGIEYLAGKIFTSTERQTFLLGALLIVNIVVSVFLLYGILAKSIQLLKTWIFYRTAILILGIPAIVLFFNVDMIHLGKIELILGCGYLILELLGIAVITSHMMDFPEASNQRLTNMINHSERLYIGKLSLRDNLRLSRRETSATAVSLLPL